MLFRIREVCSLEPGFHGDPGANPCRYQGRIVYQTYLIENGLFKAIITVLLDLWNRGASSPWLETECFVFIVLGYDLNYLFIYLVILRQGLTVYPWLA